MKKTLALHKVAILVATLVIGGFSVPGISLAAGGGVDSSFKAFGSGGGIHQESTPLRSNRGR